MDIIDHFSKWSYSYLLKTKDSAAVLSENKSFIDINGLFKIFQTDNGLEFNNLLKTYLENLNIKYVRGSPYHTQINGCVEALHKSIKNFLLNEYNSNKENFNIEISLIDACNYHNSKVSTFFHKIWQPNFLRNITDQKIIEEVKLNVVNSIIRKIKNVKLLK